MDNPTNETRAMCVICKKSITEAGFQTEEVQKMRDGFAHADCYYEKIGEVIEKHPICSPRVHRG